MAPLQTDPELRLLTEANGNAKYAPVIVVKQSANGDDTAAAQAALDKCRDAGGGEVVIPYTGTDWRFNKLTISRNTTFRCQPGVVIKRKGNSYGITNIVPGVNPLKDNADPYSGHGNIQILGGTWDGNIVSESYLPSGFNLFYLVAARGVVIEDVTVRDMVTNHCVDLNGVTGVEIRRCRFLGYKDATVDASRSYVEAIQCSQNMDDSSPAYYPMLGTPSSDITVENNTFGASGTPGTQAYPAGFGTHSSSNDPLTNTITIRNNKFNGQTFGAVVGYTYNNVKVYGNTFTGCAYGVKANNFTTGKTWNKATNTWTTGGPTRQQTAGFSVTDNDFIDTVTTDVSILGTNADVNGYWAACTDITVANNRMKATTAAKRTGNNVRLLLCNDGVAANNKCFNSADGILIDSCADIGVQGNKVTNTTAYGIKVTKTAGTPTGSTATYSSDIRVTGNSTRKTGTHGIGILTIYGFSCVGNKVMDWGYTNPGGNGILVQTSDQGLIATNELFATAAGLSAGISVGGTSTNVAITPNNRVSKPDGAKVAFTGTGVTYGTLQYP